MNVHVFSVDSSGDYAGCIASRVLHSVVLCCCLVLSLFSYLLAILLASTVVLTTCLSLLCVDSLKAQLHPHFGVWGLPRELARLHWLIIILSPLDIYST